MPELPEVETLRRELNKVLLQKKIKAIEVLWAGTIRPFSPTAFKKQLLGQTITSLDRRAKMLIVNFTSPLKLLVHLKMTGQLIFVSAKGAKNGGGHTITDFDVPNKHTRVIFTFTDNSHLHYNDLRKFGWIKIATEAELEEKISGVGIEPLSAKFTPKVLQEIFQKYPNRSLKKILLDQTLIAGIGNIYADESCFLAGLRPDRLAKTLTPIQLKKLHQNIVAVLKLSLKNKGTTSNNYCRSTGERGNFSSLLKVYDRRGEACLVCKKPIQKFKHAGRGTHFCAYCQK